GNIRVRKEGFIVSPNGRQLAVFGGSSGIWLRPLNSLNAHSLPGTNASIPWCWSPDSRFVILSKGRKLMRSDVANGGLPQTLCEIPVIGGGLFNPVAGATCSREGIVLFSADGETIWKVSIEGGTPTQVTKLNKSRQEFSHTKPWWLPD